MQLGETIATYDVALALRGESGKFDVTSPTGDIYHVTCAPNHSISNLEWAGNGKEPHPFLIRKVAEPVPAEQGKGTALADGTRTPKTPFLLENQGESARLLASEEQVAVIPKTAEGTPEGSGVVNLDLIYVEADSSRKQPSARICLTEGGKARWITPECATFNELDIEIRRLQAQLDEIRTQARKKFYKTHASAASA